MGLAFGHDVIYHRDGFRKMIMKLHDGTEFTLMGFGYGARCDEMEEILIAANAEYVENIQLHGLLVGNDKQAIGHYSPAAQITFFTRINEGRIEAAFSYPVYKTGQYLIRAIAPNESLLEAWRATVLNWSTANDVPPNLTKTITMASGPIKDWLTVQHSLCETVGEPADSWLGTDTVTVVGKLISQYIGYASFGESDLL